MTYQVALIALADPTRRLVFERLRRGPQPVGRIAEGLHVSRPAVSQHLRVLREARLVRERREGTRRIYSVEPEGLVALRRYLDEFWGDALESFKSYVESKEGGSHDRAAGSAPHRTRSQVHRRRPSRR